MNLTICRKNRDLILGPTTRSIPSSMWRGWRYKKHSRESGKWKGYFWTASKNRHQKISKKKL
ncbi:MAG: hypothetical protein WCS73_02100, partial [Lentisphaeria bacterium]